MGFGVGVFFKREHVRGEGPSKIYVRGGQEGREQVPKCSLNWSHVVLTATTLARLKIGRLIEIAQSACRRGEGARRSCAPPPRFALLPMAGPSYCPARTLLSVRAGSGAASSQCS
jgi:hypothetical protein